MDNNNNFTNPFENSGASNTSAENSAPGFGSSPSFGDTPSFGETPADASAAPSDSTASADSSTDPATTPSTPGASTGDSSSGFSEYRYNGSQMGSTGRETPFAGANQGTNPYASQPQGNPYVAQDGFGRPYGAQGGFGNPYQRQAGPSWGTPQGNPYMGQGFGQNGAPYAQSPYGGFGGPAPTPKKARKEKKRGLGAGTVALICALCVVLSLGAGFGGAWAYEEYFTKDTPIISTENGNNNVIINTAPEKEGDISTSTGVKGVYTDVVATVKDSVVEITTEFQQMGFFQYVKEGAGSGVIISADGYVITNNHVISDADTNNAADAITVRLTNGKEYDAVLVGRDADSDIAVIKIEADEPLTSAVFGNSDALSVGEEVIAVGNPLGELGGTVTNGIISALDREISVDGTTMNLLQTNAAINPGNSGGGLFNMNGELIGVVNAKSSGSGIEGLGFAIPSNDALEVATQLMEHGYVTGKTYLGISFYDVTDAYTAYRYFGTQSTGVYVVDLEEGYNDEVLEYGDRIVDIDGTEIYEFAQIKSILKDCEVGDTLKVTLYRKGKLTEVTITCFEYIPDDVPGVNFDN